jgi:hypothetical protein
MQDSPRVVSTGMICQNAILCTRKSASSEVVVPTLKVNQGDSTYVYSIGAVCMAYSVVA